MDEMLDRARRMKPVIEAHGGRYTLLNCLSGGTMTGMMASGIWGESLTALGKMLDEYPQDPAWAKLRTELQNSSPQATLGTKVMADVHGFAASLPEHTPGMVVGITTFSPTPGQTPALMQYFTDVVKLFDKAGIPTRVRRALYSGAPVSYQLTAFYKGGIGQALALWDSTVLTDPEWQGLIRRNHEAGIAHSSSVMMRPIPLD
jgi:hypothetical protein